MASGIAIENLSQFRRDLRRAESASPRLLTAGLKRAGAPVVKRAGSHAPKLTGALARSYKASVRGTTASIVNRMPYSGGAEWGQRGKWVGFTRYGSPGSRFAGRAVEELTDEIAEAVSKELEDTLTLLGWAR